MHDSARDRRSNHTPWSQTRIHAWIVSVVCLRKKCKPVYTKLDLLGCGWDLNLHTALGRPGKEESRVHSEPFFNIGQRVESAFMTNWALEILYTFKGPLESGCLKHQDKHQDSTTDEASQSLGWNVWLPEALQAGVLRLCEEWWPDQDSLWRRNDWSSASTEEATYS